MDSGAGARGMELVLLHEINAGTFARLYLAETRGSGGLDRIVAVKILREQWNEQQDIVARTRDEARLLARLRHKNILRVEDLVEVDGQTAILMEYVDGLDLKQLVDGLLDRHQRVPAKVALQIVLQAASALEAAYFRIPTGMDKPLRVIHRDVKPSNIMLSVEGEVRVLDFGTARSSHIFRSAQTGAMRFGSLKYMSPERREGDRGEHAGDVYALGMVLLELLRTEWLPLLPMDVGEHDDAIAQAIARIDHLGMPNAEWDMALRQALGQMLASEPSVRPSAEEVVGLLRSFVEHASGPMLDRFAHEMVVPMAQALRGPQQGGALAGRRLVVSALVDAKGGGSGPVSTPQPARTLDREPRPRSTGPRPSVAPEPEAPASGAAIAFGAGLVVLVIGGVLLLVALGVGGWYFFGRAEVPAAAVVVPVVPAPVPTPEPPAARSGAPIVVTTGAEPAQWVRLVSGGSTITEGRGKLDSNAPPGDYEVQVKLVGRDVVKGTLNLPESGLKLDCGPDGKGGLKCAGARRPILLKP